MLLAGMGPILRPSGRQRKNKIQKAHRFKHVANIHAGETLPNRPSQKKNELIREKIYQIVTMWWLELENFFASKLGKITSPRIRISQNSVKLIRRYFPNFGKMLTN